MQESARKDAICPVRLSHMFTIMTNCFSQTSLQYSKPEAKIYATLKLCTYKVKISSNAKA